jgi:DNA-binding NtrC family response regulator
MLFLPIPTIEWHFQLGSFAVLGQVSILLVHHGTSHMGALRFALQAQSVKAQEVKDCQDLRRTLSGIHHPCVIFTDVILPDGTWEDILAITTKARMPLNVIVVARLTDTRLYLEAIEKGVFDFLVPPFGEHDLNHVLRCAVDGVVRRARTGLHAVG